MLLHSVGAEGVGKGDICARNVLKQIDYEAMKYFEWTFDVQAAPDIYFPLPRIIGGESDLDPWIFKSCRSVQLGGQVLSVSSEGDDSEIDAISGAFNIMFVSKGLGDSLIKVAGKDVQLIEVRSSSGREYYIVNALHELVCIDEGASIFRKWEVGNEQRPDKVGQYSIFIDMKIKPDAVVGFDVFRPWGWHVALVVSERVRCLAEQFNVAGTLFRPV